MKNKSKAKNTRSLLTAKNYKAKFTPADDVAVYDFITGVKPGKDVHGVVGTGWWSEWTRADKNGDVVATTACSSNNQKPLYGLRVLFKPEMQLRDVLRGLRKLADFIEEDLSR